MATTVGEYFCRRGQIWTTYIKIVSVTDNTLTFMQTSGNTLTVRYPFLQLIFFDKVTEGDFHRARLQGKISSNAYHTLLNA